MYGDDAALHPVYIHVYKLETVLQHYPYCVLKLYISEHVSLEILSRF